MIERDWITEAGLRAVCYVVMREGRKKHRCGYVGVPVGHKFHGLDYSDSRLPDLECHGGLTYANKWGDEYPADPELWWFGFDCAHLGDGEIEADKDYLYRRDGVPRSEQYVADECESLASQIVKAA